RGSAVYARDADDAVSLGASLEGRENTERHADEQLQRERHDRELQRVRHVLHEERSRVLVVDERPAEIEMDELPHPIEVLDGKGLVEAVQMAEGLDVLVRRTRAEREEADRVAWREPDDDERDDGDPDQRRDREEQSPQDERPQMYSAESDRGRPCGRPLSLDRYFFIHPRLKFHRVLNEPGSKLCRLLFETASTLFEYPKLYGW